MIVSYVVVAHMCYEMELYLVHKMCVLGSARATKIFHLHNLRQDSLVKLVL